MAEQHNRILLPVDVTHDNDDIVRLLSTIVPLQGAEVLLLTVREQLPSYESILSSVADFPDDIAHVFEQKARTVLDGLKSQLEALGARVGIEIASGPAGMTIEQVAKDEKFYLTCVLPAKHWAAERFFLGTTSTHVVKHVPGTTLLLRPSDSDDLKDVVIGIDGSPQSHAALKTAVKQFDLKGRGSKITLCHVVSIPGALTFVSPVEFVAAIENNLSMEGETILAQGEKELSELGIKGAELMMRHGDPATELIQAAKHKRAGLLVIGAQGRTAVQHFLMGSVSTKIATQALCSTAVVKVVK